MVRRRSVVPDARDRRLLDLLRADARTPTAVLARDGVIAGYTVRLDPGRQARILRVHVLLAIDPKRSDAVIRALRAIDEIRGVYAISGAFDLLAFVEGETTEVIDRVLDAIGALPGVEKTQSSLVLSVKFDRS